MATTSTCSSTAPPTAATSAPRARRRCEATAGAASSCATTSRGRRWSSGGRPSGPTRGTISCSAKSPAASAPTGSTSASTTSTAPPDDALGRGAHPRQGGHASPCSSDWAPLPQKPRLPVAVAGDPVRAGRRRRSQRQLRLGLTRIQGQVRVPPEEEAGPPAGCRHGRLQPRHVRPSGYARTAYPTARRSAPQRRDPRHHPRHGRDASPRRAAVPGCQCRIEKDKSGIPVHLFRSVAASDTMT
uniref:Uncharacterized protein n=1 Tax=Triticum urartu TaxID=4572 RepID=A0A8R7QX68_TRIUA